MSRGDVILRLVELSKTYTGKTNVHALKNISTSFKRGEFVAVVGRSGSGKSTLINILGGLDRPTTGDYYCEGNNVSRLNEGHWDALRNKKIGFIFQNYFLIEYLTIYQNVEVALQFQNVPKAMKDAKIKAIIEKVGLIDHINKYPSQLSGGQRQRVAIARALVKDPDIILADEPTGALDWRTADEVIKLLKGESEDRLVVMVTHDRKIANKYANRIIEIDNGVFKHDLVKEEIEQTYQNVFRKIQAVTLKKKDKFIMTFNKIRANLVRNFFISLSLALAFSFSIIFNGLDRGVRTSYNNYYDTLDVTYSNAFSVTTNSGKVIDRDFINSNNRINSTLTNNKIDIILGYSKDVAIFEEMATRVINENKYTDIVSEGKLRLIDDNFNQYEHEKLFISNSKYPSNNRTIMVTSKFVRSYFDLEATDNLASYVGKPFELSNYEFEIKDELKNIVLNLHKITETESGSIEYEGTGNPLIYSELNVPQYCYYQETLDDYYYNKCEQVFTNHNIFAEYSEYSEYMDNFRSIVNLIDPNYFDLLERSNGIYHFDDLNDINQVYNIIYSNQEIKPEAFVSASEKVKFTISGIIDNEEETIMYMTQENHNDLFNTPNKNISLVNGYYTISSKDKDVFLFDKLISYGDKNIALVSNDIVESGTCEVEVISDYKTKDNSIFQDIFYYQNYLTCGAENAASSYLNMLNILFSTFFNLLMVASIIFYSMLIKVIFKARINEIGVFRSVGSTIKDIKRLFFYEVLFIFVNAIILSVAIILLLNQFAGTLFSSLLNIESNVVSIANINFLLTNATIVDISFVNLMVQVVIVGSIILYYSNRSISKIVNTNPIDILREVV
ncbi:MAG: ATP-binding cassette protein [Haloplasmataceae bacterium]|jgi:putative ABC transport system permease protein|nr:ATP-binding cassette protein [Haloplasmataceae bacterium]